ncbi:nitroreductase family protein [Paragemmobacter ruber]|uniref:Putative NAD(P)H nitroreductase n=1 Tax=Paragemmobacter ruber TaxID=1985673 RepID=A0ABW9Y5V5_9RHOB|nr:nitroreductase [Rhodobacter ruber]NBE07952.1 nitroreductase [Rhodobacter ruber]
MQPDSPAFTFLATRASYPSKLMTAPAPDRAALEPILQAALRVPDHGKLEPWRLIVGGRAALDRWADLAEARAREIGPEPERIEKGRGQFDRSHLAVIVIAAPKPSDKIPQIEQTLSAGALCAGLVNAATAAGWGANWLSGWVSHDRPFITRAFGCTDSEWVAGIIHIATPGAPLPDRPRPDLARTVTWA